MQELIYEDSEVRYEIIYSKNIKDIIVYIKGLSVAAGLLQFLELIAIMEGFLANQLPPEGDRYGITLKKKIPYLSLYLKEYNTGVFLDKAEVRIYLKILKQFEKKVENIPDIGFAGSE